MGKFDQHQTTTKQQMAKCVHNVLQVTTVKPEYSGITKSILLLLLMARSLRRQVISNHGVD